MFLYADTHLVVDTKHSGAKTIYNALRKEVRKSGVNLYRVRVEPEDMQNETPFTVHTIVRDPWEWYALYYHLNYSHTGQTSKVDFEEKIRTFPSYSRIVGPWLDKADRVHDLQQALVILRNELGAEVSVQTADIDPLCSIDWLSLYRRPAIKWVARESASVIERMGYEAPQ